MPRMDTLCVFILFVSLCPHILAETPVDLTLTSVDDSSSVPASQMVEGPVDIESLHLFYNTESENAMKETLLESSMSSSVAIQSSMTVSEDTSLLSTFQGDSATVTMATPILTETTFSNPSSTVHSAAPQVEPSGTEFISGSFSDSSSAHQLELAEPPGISPTNVVIESTNSSSADDVSSSANAVSSSADDGSSSNKDTSSSAEDVSSSTEDSSSSAEDVSSSTKDTSSTAEDVSSSTEDSSSSAIDVSFSTEDISPSALDVSSSFQETMVTNVFDESSLYDGIGSIDILFNETVSNIMPDQTEDVSEIYQTVTVINSSLIVESSFSPSQVIAEMDSTFETTSIIEKSSVVDSFQELISSGGDVSSSEGVQPPPESPTSTVTSSMTSTVDLVLSSISMVSSPSATASVGGGAVNDKETSPSKGGLSSGGKAAIGIVVTLCVVILVIVGIVLYKRYTHRSFRAFITSSVRYKTYNNASYKDDEGSCSEH